MYAWTRDRAYNFYAGEHFLPFIQSLLTQQDILIIALSWLAFT